MNINLFRLIEPLIEASGWRGGWTQRWTLRGLWVRRGLNTEAENLRVSIWDGSYCVTSFL